MKEESPLKELQNNTIAAALVILQVIAWGIGVTPIISGFTGSDAAGNAMSAGLSLVFITVPSAIFILLTSLYLLIKKNLHKFYRFVAIANFTVFIVPTIIILLNEYST